MWLVQAFFTIRLWILCVCFAHRFVPESFSERFNWRREISLARLSLHLLCFAQGFFALFLLTGCSSENDSGKYSSRDDSRLIGSQNGLAISSTEPFVVDNRQALLEVEGLEDFPAIAQGDYITFVSFLLKGFPKLDEKLILLSRNKVTSGRRSGASIALELTLDGLRPLVSEGNPARAGQWLTFSEYKLVTNRWYTLVVSHLEDGLVAVDIVDEQTGGKAVFLGAHKIFPKETKGESSRLSVGVVGAAPWQGSIGTFGILQGRGAYGLLKESLSAESFPGPTPPIELKDMTILWATPFVDSGPRSHQIKKVERSEVRKHGRLPAHNLSADSNKRSKKEKSKSKNRKSRDNRKRRQKS